MSEILHNAYCNGCHKPITSIRYKCKQCEEYNVCTTCRGSKPHTPGHIYFTIGGNRVCSSCRKHIDARDQAKRHFKCFSCLEYDLCEPCKNSGIHAANHKFLCVAWRTGMLHSTAVNSLGSPQDKLLKATPPAGQMKATQAIPAKPLGDGQLKVNVASPTKPLGAGQLKVNVANPTKPLSPGQGKVNMANPAKPIGVVPAKGANPVNLNLGIGMKANNLHQAGGASAMFKPAASETHFNTTCSGCHQSPIQGIRFKCSKCAHFDLCETCKTGGIHKEHQFYPVKSEAGRKTQTSVLYNPWETERKLVKLGPELGRGSFGEVYKGSWKNMTVAIKKLQKDTMDVKDFLAEAELMAKLKHNNIVTLLAVVSRKEPVLIITEFMDQGSLSSYLNRHKPNLPMTTLIWIAMETADGMRYLESENYVHRDLAARNVLVGTGNNSALTIKICDFGLTRLLTRKSENATLMYKSTSPIFPQRWTAPEAMPPEKKFTSKSDVWSFGILLTEIVTFGRCPYHNIPNENVERHVQAGNIMSRPAECQESLYTIMKKTWSKNARDRPTFKDILPLLQNCFQDAQQAAKNIK